MPPWTAWRWLPLLRRSVVVAVAATTVAGGLAAQKPDSAAARADSARRADSVRSRVRAQEILNRAPSIKLWHAGAVIGGVALISTIDEPVQRYFRRHRSSTLGDVATVFRQQGEPWYYVGSSLALFGAGLLLDNPEIRRAGRRMAVSVAGSGLVTYAIKGLVGRSRPNENVGAYTFHPFSSLEDSAGIETRGALPSGHTVAAFAVATSLADDIDHPIATIALYTLAAGAGWSRLYDNRHWLSDVALGVVLGITTSKVVSGRWRLFGWRPPAAMVRPTGDVALQWTVPLRPSLPTGGDP